MSTLRITQVRSTIGRTQDQRDTVRSIGLKRIRHSVEREDGPELRGMLRKVPHLVEWEFLDGDQTAASDTQAGEAITSDEES
jgi:large subunit ribosomal protein L30